MLMKLTPVDESWTTILNKNFVDWVVVIVFMGLILDTHDAGPVVITFLAFVHRVAIGDHVVVVKLDRVKKIVELLF